MNEENKTARPKGTDSEPEKKVEMDMYKKGNRLMISVENLSEFKELLERASRETKELNKTINQLSQFDLSILFSAQSD